MVLTGRADPALGTTLADVLGDADVVVDFTRPDTALENALECVAAGVHVVIGTTGFDLEPLRERRAAPNVFFAPNFAIGAVLMMSFAAEASQAHGEGRDHRAAPRRQARRAVGHRGAHGRADGRATSPIHSVRLPGLVAHQEVILGDLGQTLTIRHDSIDRESFMPGVLLGVRRVGELTSRRSSGSSTCCSDGAGGRCHGRGHRPRRRALPPARRLAARAASTPSPRSPGG